MTDKKQKKVAPPSPENVYHILAGSDPDLAARDGILYRWTGGSFWAAQDVMVEESRAFRWLQTQYPDKATPPPGATVRRSGGHGGHHTTCPS